MKTKLIAGVILAFVSMRAEAAFIGRAPLTPGGSDYRAYYHTDLDITWTRDANLASTQTFGVVGIIDAGQGPGEMTWQTALDWIAAMNAADYLGANQWRLPSTLQPDPTCEINDASGSSGGSCRGSEMGYLHWENGISWGSMGSGFAGPFLNVGSTRYWSATEYLNSDTGLAWTQSFHVLFNGTTPGGTQRWRSKTDYYHAWAVHDGDPFAVVPVPAAAWLFASSLGGLAWLRRR